MRHLAENHPVPELLREFVYARSPGGRHGRVSSVQDRRVPLQSFPQDEVDVKAAVVPVLHHATDLELYRPVLPRVADQRVSGSRLVDILHVVPNGAAHSIVPEAVTTPASAAGDRVLELTSDGHYQRSPGKIFEVPVADRNLVGCSWIV